MSGGAGLPTRQEMLQNALASMEQARNALSDARDWLASDWQPLGSPLTDDQAAARTATRAAIGGCKREIDRATEALRRAIADGQRQLVNSTDLPAESRWTDDAEYEALGFTLGEPHQHDPLFRPATLPAGWKREGSEHAMWSYIVDEKGRRRVSIFYKAAFYDRKASMNLLSPTYQLSEIHYGDAEPTSLPTDEWLTVDLARAWIEQEREHHREHRDTYLTPGTDPYAEYTSKLARLDAMAALLPEVRQGAS